LSKSKLRGSDHYFHLMLIKQIKENKNRFIRNFNNIIGNSYVFYPQFLHWLLSYFYPKRISVAIKLHNVFVYLVTGIMAFFFWKFYLEHYYVFLVKDEFYVLLFVGLIISLTPYSYHLKNAKNSGLSARSFGIFLVHAYLYSLALMINSSPWFFLSASLSVLLIFISSQFALQFIIFSTPIIALMALNLSLMGPLVLGLILFLILFNKIATTFLYGQFNHKRIYYKYLADSFILKIRFSIWRDWIYDFWLKLFRAVKKKESFNASYFYENSLFILIFLFPGIPCLAIYYILGGKDFTIINGELFWTFLFSSLFLFFIFSFRKTRFLGEPERYVEFTIPFIAFICVFLLPPAYLTGIVVYGSLMSLLQIWIGYYTNRIKKSTFPQIRNKFDPAIKLLLRDPNARVLTNETEVTKLFFPEGIKIFRFGLQYEYAGKIHFKKIFADGYDRVSSKVIPDMISEFNINYLLLNKNFVPVEDRFWENNTEYADLWNEENYLLLFRKGLTTNSKVTSA